VSSQAARFARRPARARARRRRLALVVLALVVGGGAAALFADPDPLEDAVREVTLPLHHDDIIRQQASDKDIDADLIAAVIYEESRFRDQTSHAGARGLMQITPETADFIARRSGGVLFEQSDLATPQVNIAYGSWYLRYLIDRYDGNETLAVAAYNAGQTNVDRWVRDAGGPEEFDTARHIPFPETRAYVQNVEERRVDYRERYAGDLGL
jgi:soluble lytic murein transglycosylase